MPLPEERKQELRQVIRDQAGRDRPDAAWVRFYNWVARQQSSAATELRSASDLVSVGRAQGKLHVLDQMSRIADVLIQEINTEE